MITREYDCPKHGYFTEAQNISAPSEAKCPKCFRQARRVFVTAPTFNSGRSKTIAQALGEPDYDTDPKGYREWQVERMAQAKDQTHPDNLGKDNPSVKQLTTKTATGKNR